VLPVASHSCSAFGLFGVIDPFPPLFADTIESDARLVFSDVVDEFCSVRGVASRFESWRNTDAVAYREAYVSLCLPKVLGPLVRLKMIMWNPLQVNLAVTC
jgi:GC-rich sequence DNA-binding factor